MSYTPKGDGPLKIRVLGKNISVTKTLVGLTFDHPITLQAGDSLSIKYTFHGADSDLQGALVEFHQHQKKGKK